MLRGRHWRRHSGVAHGNRCHQPSVAWIRPHQADKGNNFPTSAINLSYLVLIFVCQYTNDFNISSPILAQSKQLPDQYFEFGRYVEEKIFGAAVHWILNDDTIPVEHLQRIVTSVRDNKMIPKFEDTTGILIRDLPLLVALDCDTNKTYF